jgi:pyruvate-formate lyase
MKDVKAVEAVAMAAGCTVPTMDIVQKTSKVLEPMQTRKAVTPNFGIRWYATLSHMYLTWTGKLSMNRFYSKESYYNRAFAFSG